MGGSLTAGGKWFSGRRAAGPAPWGAPESGPFAPSHVVAHHAAAGGGGRGGGSRGRL